ncbi:MAG: dolichyl-phosphate-mannose-protein mannosyltransferase [Amphiamblys sp. WSBS2006]|nr:MAG: dolichyl-phosphate-mannose-protein mannosyltransferase [Amphiamblys sp. WSBS2006]
MGGTEMKPKVVGHGRTAGRLDIACVLTAVSFFVHFILLGHPASVVFDEFHFGKFAGYYLRREFYFDVHPPLGKMLFSLAGYIAGYGGGFDFTEVNAKYGPNFPFVSMRALSSLFGTLLTPIVFLTLQGMGVSADFSAVGSLLVAFDNGLITQTRFILLDSPLMFFIFLSVLCYVRFTRAPQFSLGWAAWLFLTGTFLGCAMSVKLVGVFVFGLVVCGTAVELWHLSGPSLGLREKDVWRNVSARLLGLFFWPASLYLFFYYLHVKILSGTGPGDTHMSPEFQAGLANSHLSKASTRVCYGAAVVLKNRAEDVYLHSLGERYPREHRDGKVGSGGQLLGGAKQKAAGSRWVVQPREGESVRVVQDGDTVRLQHADTGLFLMTHDVASPLTKTNQEVTFQKSPAPDGGVNQITDVDREWTEWKIGIRNTNELCAVCSRFTLTHVKTGVVLINHKRSLPQWGRRWREINGQKNKTDAAGQWIVEDVENPKGVVLKTELPFEKMSTLERIVEVQLQSLRHNSKLTGESIIDSKPWTWPFCLKGGIPFWSEKGKDGGGSIVMEGNRAVWYPIPFAVLVLSGITALVGYWMRRGTLSSESTRRTAPMAGLCAGGYLVHYVPFFFMGRTLYLHHYLPCVVFGVMCEMVLLDLALRRTRRYVRGSVSLLILSSVFYYFTKNTARTYGVSV